MINNFIFKYSIETIKIIYLNFKYYALIFYINISCMKSIIFKIFYYNIIQIFNLYEIIHESIRKDSC